MNLEKKFEVAKDAWSSGQVGSKIWLCRELEKFYDPDSPGQVIWVLGGWQGVLSFLLFSREKIPVERVRSFDIDPAAEKISDALNENWVWRNWTFKAFTHDCNLLNYQQPEKWASTVPTLVINTSTEHFESQEWFERIPSGTRTVLQSNNLVHEEHTHLVQSIDEFKEKFPLASVEFEGELEFRYPDTSFKRFMLIGRR